jgi:hypothetical protein
MNLFHPKTDKLTLQIKQKSKKPDSFKASTKNREPQPLTLAEKTKMKEQLNQKSW